MDRMLYISMSGAKQNMLAQAVNAHNLANVSTTGFKADLDVARSYQVRGPGFPSRVYAVDVSNGTDLKSGTLMTTGRPMDVAIKGKGWLTVTDANGQEAYTRAGNLHVTQGGELMTAEGRQVMGLRGPMILPPSDKVEIGVDGTLSVIPTGQDITAFTVVDTMKLVNPPARDLVKGEDGLMRLRGNNSATQDASVRLASGTLESSNVNAVEAMVDMITLSRQFEAQVKLMKSSEEMDAASATLLRLA